jgi:drug/metabolite transporter (DMT)-like permease
MWRTRSHIIFISSFLAITLSSRAADAFLSPGRALSSCPHRRRSHGLPAATLPTAEPAVDATLSKKVLPDSQVLSDTLLEIPEGVVCARGICVVDDESLVATTTTTTTTHGDLGGEAEEVVAEGGLNINFLWPRVLLLISSVLYGTNFPLGRLMNDALPASASTSARFVLAFGALLPFLPKLSPALRGRALLCGCFTALGYVGQSLALVDTPAATVSFLGCLTVVVCPLLSVLVDRKQLSFNDAPQVWVAAGLALTGVGVLELGPLLFDSDTATAVTTAATSASASSPTTTTSSYAGDVWSVLQAVGFGTSFFLTERMMAREPGQALPITAVQCGVTAAIAAAWAAADGCGLLGAGGGGGGGGGGGSNAAWLLDEATRSAYAFPGLVQQGLDGLDGLFGGVGAEVAASAGLQAVAAAAAWTGLVTTAGNRLAETTALGKVSSSEASVLLATEPLWACFFASSLIGELPGGWDAVGGSLLVVACLANSAEEPLRGVLGIAKEAKKPEEKDSAVSTAGAAAAAEAQIAAAVEV